MRRHPAHLVGPLLALLVVGGLTSAVAAPRRSLTYKLPTDALESFTFSARHRVQTELTELPPEADLYDTTALASALADVAVKVDGRLERTVGRVFRDRSLGLVTRLVGVRAELTRGDAASPVALDGLEGKSVSMRVLESGELLAAVGWEHLSGAGRGGDLVQDVLLLSVLRLPYVAPSDTGAIPTSFRLRVPIDAVLNRDQAWSLAWTATEVPADCRGCVAVAYSGTMTEAAADRHPARPMDLTATGTAAGVVLLDRAGRLRKHEFSVTWSRSIRALRENDVQRAALRQEHSITGEIVGVAR